MHEFNKIMKKKFVKNFHFCDFFSRICDFPPNPGCDISDKKEDILYYAAKEIYEKYFSDDDYKKRLSERLSELKPPFTYTLGSIPW